MRGLTAALFLVGVTTVCAGTARSAGPVPLRPIASSIPALHGAVAIGALVALDPKSDVAEFRIRCGWHAARGKPTDPQATMPERKLRPGLWKVSLRGFAFTVETYPNGPASGVANAKRLETWERHVARFRWSGTLFLPNRWSKPFLSDGPTTDICHGVLG